MKKFLAISLLAWWFAYQFESRRDEGTYVTIIVGPYQTELECKLGAALDRSMLEEVIGDYKFKDCSQDKTYSF